MTRRYDVVVWYKPQPGLSSQLVARAGREADEGSETALGADLHWSFDNAVKRCPKLPPSAPTGNPLRSKNRLSTY